MILYRIEFPDGKGCWNSNTARRYKDNYVNISKILCDIGEELHAPQSYEMTYDEEKGFPYNGKYYFKVTSKLDYMKLYEAFSKYTEEVKLIKIDTDDLQRYEIYYQDENQVFLEIK